MFSVIYILNGSLMKSVGCGWYWLLCSCCHNFSSVNPIIQPSFHRHFCYTSESFIISLNCDAKDYGAVTFYGFSIAQMHVFHTSQWQLQLPGFIAFLEKVCYHLHKSKSSLYKTFEISICHCVENCPTV